MLEPQTKCLSEVYTLRLLETSDVPEVIELQQIVIDRLPDDQKYDISHKTAEEFGLRMTDWGKMVGVFKRDGQQLVAYGTLALPNKQWPIGDLCCSQAVSPCKPELLAVFQNNAVHPDFRGKGLQNWMLKAKADLCPALGRRHILAQIMAYNAPSLKNYLSIGFLIVHANVTPLRKCRMVIAHLDLHVPAFVQDETDSLLIDPVANFDELMGLLDRGYRGVALQRMEGQQQEKGGILLKLAR